MTKEELESKFDDCFDANTKASEGGYGPDITYRMGLWEGIYPIISEYVQQQCLDFDIYKREQGYVYEYASGEYMKFNAEHVHESRLLPSQLYDQFIESQNK